VVIGAAQSKRFEARNGREQSTPFAQRRSPSAGAAAALLKVSVAYGTGKNIVTRLKPVGRLG
jgi:hypothetical protein